MYEKLLLELHKLQYKIPNGVTSGLWVLMFFAFIMGYSTVAQGILVFLLAKMLIGILYLRQVYIKLRRGDSPESIKAYVSHRNVKLMVLDEMLKRREQRATVIEVEEIKKKQVKDNDAIIQNSSEDLPPLSIESNKDDAFEDAILVEEEEGEQTDSLPADIEEEEILPTDKTTDRSARDIVEEGAPIGKTIELLVSDKMDKSVESTNILTVGKVVAVKNGITHPNFDNFDISGFKGRIIELLVHEGEEVVRIQFDTFTLNLLPIDYIKQCYVEGYNFYEIYLFASDVVLSEASDSPDEALKTIQQIIAEIETEIEDASKPIVGGEEEQKVDGQDINSNNKQLDTPKPEKEYPNVDVKEESPQQEIKEPAEKSGDYALNSVNAVTTDDDEELNTDPLLEFVDQLQNNEDSYAEQLSAWFFFLKEHLEQPFNAKIIHTDEHVFLEKNTSVSVMRLNDADVDFGLLVLCDLQGQQSDFPLAYLDTAAKVDANHELLYQYRNWFWQQDHKI